LIVIGYFAGLVDHREALVEQRRPDLGVAGTDRIHQRLHPGFQDGAVIGTGRHGNE